MTGLVRAAALPVVAVLLVAGVLSVQLGHGGGSFAPLRPADPCLVRGDTSAPADLDALTERVVLLGLDAAACDLHVSREELTLDLAESAAPTDAQLAALHAGLLSAVRRMRVDGTLPPSSDLVDQALDATDLNEFLKAAIRALPDALVDSALPTDDVLTRTIDDLDLRTLLANADDEAGLEQQLDAAVIRAVRDTLTARLRGLL